MADDLVAGSIEDHGLALEDRHERVLAITNLIEHIADVSRPFFTEFGEARQLGTRTASGSAGAAGSDWLVAASDLRCDEIGGPGSRVRARFAGR